MKVAIIGQGYVGQTLAIGAAKSGYEVVGLDLNTQLISDLERGDSFVPGIEKETLLNLIIKKDYEKFKIRLQVYTCITISFYGRLCWNRRLRRCIVRTIHPAEYSFYRN